MRLKCPHCGHVGSDEQQHQLFERWSTTEFGHTDESATIIAAGFEPDRTSAAWFRCGVCEKESPFYSWKAHRPDSLEDFNTVMDEPPYEKFDPSNLNEPWWPMSGDFKGKV